MADWMELIKGIPEVFLKKFPDKYKKTPLAGSFLLRRTINGTLLALLSTARRMNQNWRLHLVSN